VITRRVVAVSASLALGAGLLLAATPVVNAADAAPQVDDCIQVNDDILWEADAPVSIVECSEPHNAEVFAILAYPANAGAPSTLKDRIWDLFGGECNQGTALAWLGAPTSAALPLRLYTVPRIPTDEEWKAGARWVACTASRPSSTDGNVASLTQTLPELYASTSLQDWVNCLKGAPSSGRWLPWAPCTSKSKWLVVQGVQVKGKVTGNYPKDLQAKANGLCAKQAKKFLKKGAKTKPVAGLGPKKDFPQGDPFADCFIAFADWNGSVG
jgi:hypothetical protein